MNRIAVLILIIGLTPAYSRAQENWPRFRGNNGAGVSNLKGLPESWTPDDYDWNIELPGKGHSSPIIWGRALFVTSATRVNNQAARHLICLDATTGKQRWTRSVQLAP